MENDKLKKLISKPPKPPAWRVIYNNLDDIEDAIKKGCLHKDISAALGISQAAYSKAKNKAYAHQKANGKHLSSTAQKANVIERIAKQNALEGWDKKPTTNWDVE